MDLPVELTFCTTTKRPHESLDEDFRIAGRLAAGTIIAVLIVLGLVRLADTLPWAIVGQ